MSKICFLILYADDILLVTNDNHFLYKGKILLFKSYYIKDICYTSYVIGIKKKETKFVEVWACHKC